MSDKINILLLSLYYYDEDEQYLLNICKNGVSAAHHTFINNLIKGLSVNANLSLLTSLPIGSFPIMSNKLKVKTKIKNCGYEIGYINLPFIKDLVREELVTKYILRWAKKINNEYKYVIIYDSVTPFVKGALKAQKIDNKIKNIMIIPDLPGEYSIENNSYSTIVDLILKKRAERFYRIIGMIDAFIPLTELMMNVLNAKKPYMVMECIVDNNLVANPVLIKKDKKVIMYAGELSSKVNLDILLKAVRFVKYEKYELWICGNGKYENKIKQIALNNNHIKFLGFIPKKELIKLQEKVDVFINPRQNEGIFTKYSFPSKNAEYLVTGKPVIAYKLEGIPNEYYDYLYTPSSNSPEELAKTIDIVLQLKHDDLINLSEKQILFMQKNKSLSAQCKRIIRFLRELN